MLYVSAPDVNALLQINVYDLKAKNVMQIIPQRQGFTISNQSLELTPDLHLILRFRRAFDNDFALGAVTVSFADLSAALPQAG